MGRISKSKKSSVFSFEIENIPKFVFRFFYSAMEKIGYQIKIRIKKMCFEL